VWGGAVEKTAFDRALDDFYLTNPIARASAIMAECSVIAERHGALTAAE
jgi:NADH-quinone oxidoreductase subunit G